MIVSGPFWQPPAPYRFAKKTPKQRRSIERVEDILETTRRLILHQGIESITTKRLASEARIPIASIYQYFIDKEAIVYTFYDHWLSEALMRILASPELKLVDQHIGKYFITLNRLIIRDFEIIALDKNLFTGINHYPKLDQILDNFKHQLSAAITSTILSGRSFTVKDSDNHRPPAINTNDLQTALRIVLEIMFFELRAINKEPMEIGNRQCVIATCESTIEATLQHALPAYFECKKTDGAIQAQPTG